MSMDSDKPKIVTLDTVLPSGWGYSVMRKLALALASIVLIAFVIGHWAGNLNLLQGETVFNDYVAWLQRQPLLHYGVWLLISLALVLHLTLGIYHWWHNRHARDTRYQQQRYVKTSLAARTMIISGLLLLLFIVVHIAHVRGWLQFSQTHTVYQNLQAGLAVGWLLALYIVGQIALAFHLYHGVWSLFQTLGIHHPRYNHWRRPFAIVIAVGLAFLNIVLIVLNSRSVMT